MEHNELCITVNTGLRQLTLPTARWIQLISPTTPSVLHIHRNITLPSTPKSPKWSISHFPINIPYVFLRLPRFILVTLITFCAEWKLIRYSLHNFLYYPYIVTPRSKYHPEHAVLRRLLATLCQYSAKWECTWAGTFHRKQFTSLREGSHVKQTPPVQTTRKRKAVTDAVPNLWSTEPWGAHV